MNEACVSISPLSVSAEVNWVRSATASNTGSSGCRATLNFN